MRALCSISPSQAVNTELVTFRAIDLCGGLIHPKNGKYTNSCVTVTRIITIITINTNNGKIYQDNSILESSIHQ